jgi:predicted short-subunit dehydrogenase-like oxidoreductase (DUF2520 family)
LIGDTFFCVEGQPKAVRVARRLVREIGGRFFEIPTEQKSLYHAAAVLASGGVTALISISLELLSKCGLSEREARKVLLPLVNGTVGNIRLAGPAKAYTGPVKRGDAGTIESNLKSLSTIDPEWTRLYLILACRGLELAKRAGVDESVLAPVRALIESPPC